MTFSAEARDHLGNSRLNTGQITFDVKQLEGRLTARLTSSKNPEQRIEAVSKTFEEIIENDSHFGSLLVKIK